MGPGLSGQDARLDPVAAYALASRVVKSRVMLRMSPELHEALKAKAREQGVSLNQWLVSVLAGAVGFTPTTTKRPGGAENTPGPAHEGAPHGQQEEQHRGQ